MVNSKVKVDGQSRRKSIEDSPKDARNPEAIEEVSLEEETGEEVIIKSKKNPESSKKRKAKGVDDQDEDQHQHRPKRRSRAGKYGKRLHGSRSRSPTISISSNSSGGSISITNSVNSSSVSKSNSKSTLKKTSSRNNKKSTTATAKPRKARTGSSKKTAKSTSNNSKSKFNFNLKIRQMNSILKKAKSTTKTTRKLSPSTKTSDDPETRASESPSHNRNDSGVDEDEDQSPALSGNESDTSPKTSSKEITTAATAVVESGEEKEIPGTYLSSDDVTSNDSGVKGNVTIIHDLKICAKSCKCPPPVVWFKCPFCTRVYDSLEKVRDHRISLHEVNRTHSETLRDNEDGRDNLNVDEKQDNLSSDSDEEERLHAKKKVQKGKATRAPRKGPEVHSNSESDEEPRVVSSVPVIKPKGKPTPANPSSNSKGMLHKQKQRRRLSGTGESKPNGW